MKIGIDIDDVIVDTSKLIEEYITKLDNNGDIINHMEEIMRGDIPNEIISRFIDSNVIEIMRNAKVKENAKSVLKKLKESNEIILVTSRGEEKFKGTEKLTLDYLKENGIEYDKIIFNAFDKASICKVESIDVLIDDSIKLCEEADKIGVRAIVFNSIANKNRETKLKRVNNWKDLEKII